MANVTVIYVTNAHREKLTPNEIATTANGGKRMFQVYLPHRSHVNLSALRKSPKREPTFNALRDLKVDFDECSLSGKPAIVVAYYRPPYRTSTTNR